MLNTLKRKLAVTLALLVTVVALFYANMEDYQKENLAGFLKQLFSSEHSQSTTGP